MTPPPPSLRRPPSQLISTLKWAERFRVPEAYLKWVRRQTKFMEINVSCNLHKLWIQTGQQSLALRNCLGGELTGGEIWENLRQVPIQVLGSRALSQSSI